MSDDLNCECADDPSMALTAAARQTRHSSSATQARVASRTRALMPDDDELDEYDRSKFVPLTSSRSATPVPSRTAAGTTRVKMLWSAAKEDEEDGDGNDASVAQRRHSSSSNGRSRSRTLKPTVRPPPRSIQKREQSVATATAAAVAPSPSLGAPVGAPTTAAPVPSREEVVERLQHWEADLHASVHGNAQTPTTTTTTTLHLLTRTLKGSDSLSMAFRKACGEIMRQYPQSANKMMLDRRLWTSWYKEISQRQAELRIATTAAAAVATQTLAAPSEDVTDDATRTLERVLTQCTAFYERLVNDLRVLLAREQKALDQAARSSTSTSNAQNESTAAAQQLQVIQYLIHTSLVALGDTARYAQRVRPRHTSNSSALDWTVAQQHYEDALLYAPTRGKAYNQLALVAIFHNRVLAAVYLNARSLACAAPFSSRENFVTALKRVNTGAEPPAARDQAVADVQRHVDALFVSCVSALYERKSSRHGADFHARVHRFDAGLPLYLNKVTSALLARASLDLDSVRTGLQQIVSVVIFLVHDLQMPSTSGASARPQQQQQLTASSFDNEVAGWRERPNAQRALSLGCSVITSLMHACAKAVVAPEYMAIARDLMNTLLPPISVYLDWLRLHPWFLTPSAGASDSASRVLSATVRFLAAIASSLLADRILDEDLQAMSAKELPEDRELRGFRPLEPSSRQKATKSVVVREADAPRRPYDDDALLDMRMCRVLSFRNDFVRLSDAIAAATTAAPAPLRAATNTVAPLASALPLPAFESSASASDDNDDDDNSSSSGSSSLESPPSPDSEAVHVPLQSPTTVASTPSTTAAAAGRKVRRRSLPAATRQVSSLPPRASDSVERPRDDASLAFAAVMAIGADKTLYEASSTSPAAAAEPQKCLIVIDAPNVAMRHGYGKRFSCAGIRLACDYYVARGHRVVGFLPDYLLDVDQVDARRRAVEAGDDVPAAKVPDDVALLQTMVEQGLLVPTPAQDYDDSYCIQYAGMYDGCVVTNDLYRDHIETMSGPRERKTAMRAWLAAHRVSYSWVRNEFLPNPSFKYPKPARL